MKLVYLVQYFSPEKASGLQLVEDLLDGFSAHGWKTDVFTPTPTRGVTDEQRKEYARKRVEVKYDGKLTIHRMHLYREGKGFVGRAIRYVLFSIECFWKAATVPADFIFTGSGPPTQGVVVGLAKKVSGKKVIYNLQDIFPDSLVTSGICGENSFLMKIGHAMENFTYRNADHIITITDDMKANIMKKGVPEDKISVVRNWIDTEKIKPISRDENKLFDELGLSRNHFYVTYAGNLGYVQAVDCLVQVATALQEDKEIEFIIFGNGSEENRIKDAIKSGNLKNIRLLPLQSADRISEVYSMGDLSLVSCQKGTGKSGMPSKTWLIMAAETAVLGYFDKGGEFEKIVHDNQCGVCVQAGELGNLTKIIKELSLNKEQCKKMGKNARQYSLEHVSKKKAVTEYIEIIEKTYIGRI